MGQGPQKPDHGGNFFMVPRRTVNSVAWKHLSYRAIAVLQVFQCAHDGFNNGRIRMGIHDIGKALGNQNHGANSRAVAELIEKGFLECTSDADRNGSLVREYRITFISTGSQRAIEKATHDYESWRPAPGKTRKFGGAKTTTQKPDSVAETTKGRKLTPAETATGVTESCGFEGQGRVAETALHLDNQSIGSPQPLKIYAQNHPNSSGAIEQSDLRQWMLAVIQQHGYGGQRKLAHDASVPEPVLSRFKNGGNLPEHYLMSLQTACGRALPFKRWKEAA
jgi:hypothetical protein|tara:strand:- start:691 stop:1527 length:837 start_codon:yes stop_codon:yes gene_type:complete